MGFFDRFKRKKTDAEGSAPCSILTRFDTSKIHELSTWDFWLHFQIPAGVSDQRLLECVSQLSSKPLVAANASSALTLENFRPAERLYSVALNVPEERRRQPDALSAYESDMWRVMGHMAVLKPTEILYD